MNSWQVAQRANEVARKLLYFRRKEKNYLTKSQ